MSYRQFLSASYARNSYPLHDERSVADQQRRCRDRASSDGLEIRLDFEFVEKSISGEKPDRAGCKALP